MKVVSIQAFERFIASRLPHGLDVDLATIPDRATAVTLLANAKAIGKGLAQGVLVRATKPGVVISSVDGRSVIPVSEQTAQAGGCLVQLSSEREWGFSGTIAVVENTDPFWRHHLVLPNVDLAILSGGNMSTRLLKWLASPAMDQCQFLHWGDYDPVGVFQYLRLAKDCPGRTAAYAPENLEILLPKYGKQQLVTEQVSYLGRIRAQQADPYVRRMVDLFDKHRRGLEQEIYLRIGAIDGSERIVFAPPGND